ncbi:MAG: 4Fe-4S binding protein [Chloroflexi bacterium]|nr:4Fe-4S binding protein [Chloroflexota bacterium]MDA8187447.1 4Fe-4S binding protein [Dehalococcoidales bacterium]
MPPRIDAAKCNGCGTCDRHCPIDVIELDKGKRLAVVKYPDECWHCGSCRLDCKEGAVEIVFPPRMLLV